MFWQPKVFLGGRESKPQHKISRGPGARGAITTTPHPSTGGGG